MTKYVIGPDVAIRLAHDQTVIDGEHQLLAPALLRSQTLSLLYQEVHGGEMTKNWCWAKLEPRHRRICARRSRRSRMASRRGTTRCPTTRSTAASDDQNDQEVGSGSSRLPPTHRMTSIMKGMT